MEGVNLWQVVISIILTIISFLIGIIGVLLKGLKTSLDDRLNKQDERIEKLTGQIANLPHVYVLRDDFIRAISGIDTRIELEFKEISKQFKEYWQREAERRG